MKGVMKWIIFAIVLLFLVPAVSGSFSVSSITIDPSGSLTPGTPVLVSYKIQFAASGDTTFPSASELQMSTDLDKAKWSYTLILDSIENPRPQESGRMLSLGGWEISYPDEVEESIRVTLEGTVPEVTQTTNKTIIRIVEVDQNNNVVESSRVERTAMVVNINDLKAAINAKKIMNFQFFRRV